MPPLLSKDENTIDIMGLAIHKNDHGGTHIGIVYRPERDPYFLHHGWDKLTPNENLSIVQQRLASSQQEMHFAKSNLNQHVQKLIAGYANNLQSKDPKIPYGFADFLESFDRFTAEYIQKGDERGLTCSTFVLAVLWANNLSLLQLADWPIRDEDKDFFLKIIYWLQTNSRNKHVNKVVEATKQRMEAKTLKRFRPEEVVAAFTENQESWPVSSNTAIPKGEAILSEVMA